MSFKCNVIVDLFQPIQIFISHINYLKRRRKISGVKKKTFIYGWMNFNMIRKKFHKEVEKIENFLPSFCIMFFIPFSPKALFLSEKILKTIFIILKFLTLSSLLSIESAFYCFGHNPSLTCNHFVIFKGGEIFSKFGNLFSNFQLELELIQPIYDF